MLQQGTHSCSSRILSPQRRPARGPGRSGASGPAAARLTARPRAGSREAPCARLGAGRCRAAPDGGAGASSSGAAHATPPAPPPHAARVWEADTAQGRLVVYPIARGDVQAAGVVLTRAFAGTAESVALSAVLQDIASLAEQQSQPPPPPHQQPGGALPPRQDAFLVARLRPPDPASPLLPPGQASRLIGTAAVSISPASQLMSRLPQTNLPPPSAAYISNMAVDAKFRRRGVARALLAACEDVARQAGAAEAWLHVREADGGARALYGSEGYGVVRADAWLEAVRYGMRTRLLMRRAL